MLLKETKNNVQKWNVAYLNILVLIAFLDKIVTCFILKSYLRTKSNTDTDRD